MPEKSGISGLIDELRRRRVFRVAAFYGGIAFVIVQIIDGTFDLMGVPQWVGRVMVTLLALGFPVSMILAWVFDITPEGIVRTDKIGLEDANQDIGRKSQPMIGNKALAVIAISAVAFGLWGRWGRVTPVSSVNANSSIRSIAVLPLDNHTGDPSQDYFVDGMTEALINELARLKKLKVISRTSAMRYKNSDKSVPQMAAELGVDALVEGSVIRDGNRVRITAQLIRGSDDVHLWSDDFERDNNGILKLHKEVALAIVGEIELVLTPREKSVLEEEAKIDPRAFDLYIRARNSWNMRTAEGIRDAIRLFHQSIEIAPQYAIAYSGLADAYALLPNYVNYNQDDASSLARAAAREALKYDAGLGQPYAAIGFVSKNLDSLRYYLEKSIDVSPNYATAYHWLANVYYNEINDTSNARLLMLQAASLDPLSNVIRENLVYYNDYYAGRWDSMLRKTDDFLTVSPDYRGAVEAKGIALYFLGRVEDSEPYLLKSASSNEAKLLYKGLISVAQNDSAAIVEIVNDLSQTDDFRSGYNQIIYIRLLYEIGRTDEAFTHLGRSLAIRNPRTYPVITRSPFLKPLKSDPRFRRIVETMHASWDQRNDVK